MQPVVIGPREIYDSVQGLHTQIAVMCEKLDRVSPRLEDHEGRLRSLEGRRWPLQVLAGLAALAALFLVGVELVG